MSDPTYVVGRGRPPRHTQFKMGQSGNPAGRPKGARNLRSEMLDELRSQVTAKEGGRQVKVSKGRLVIKSLIAKAAGGDMKAVALVLDLILKLDLPEQDGATVPDSQALEPEDAAIVDAFVKRVRQGCDHE
jgi:hypothetical protein